MRSFPAAFNRFHHGFSMAEVAVVVAIVSILMAIAIPRFTASTNASSNRTAQASVMLAYEAQRIVARSLDGYTSNGFALER